MSVFFSFFLKDCEWLGHRTEKQSLNYRAFQKSIRPTDRLLIVEIGCGTAVMTTRRETNMMQNKFKDTVLVRINARESAVQRKEDVGIGLSAKEALFKIKQLL